MLILRNLESVRAIPQIELRDFILRRLEQICDGAVYDPDIFGQFILVEVGDAATEVEAATGCHIVTSYWDRSRFGDADFSGPSFEWVAEHAGADGNSGWYEAPIITSNDGAGFVFIVPKGAGIDAELLSLCSAYAEPIQDGLSVASDS